MVMEKNSVDANLDLPPYELVGSKKQNRLPREKKIQRVIELCLYELQFSMEGQETVLYIIYNEVQYKKY